MYDLVHRLAIVQLLLCSIYCASVVDAAILDHTVSLVVIDYIVDYLRVPAEYSYSQDLAVSLNFLLAAKHINERRSDILPALAFPNCPVNVSVVAYVDDGGFAGRTMFAMNQYNTEVDAVVGLSWSPVVAHAGFLSTALSLPLVSDWASSPLLNDKIDYPLFARTIPDDGVTAVKIVNMLHQWGYGRYALLYDEAQSVTRDVFDARSEALGMNLTAFAVTENARSLLNDAVRAISLFNLNILVIHCPFHLLRTTLADALAANGYLDADKLIVFTDFDHSPTQEDFVRFPLLKPLFRGAFRVESGNQDPALFDAYLRLWDTEFASPSYISYLNSFLPPNGNASNMDLGALDVSNWGYSMNVSGPSFFRRTKPAAHIVWGMAYDAVVALALAKCQLIRSGKEPSRVRLWKQMLETRFEGLSGPVRFTNDGNRNSTTLTYLARNWDLDSNVHTVGVYNEQLDEFVFTAPLHFRLGRMPPEITPPPQNKQHLPLGWKILGYVEIGILNAFAIICIFWTFWYRKHKAVFHAQPTFLYLIALGCMIASISILSFTVDDDDNGVDTNICMLGPWAFTVGYMLALTSLLAKMIRILNVFTAPIGSTARALVHRPVAIGGIALVLAIEIALLVVWTVLNPLVWQRIVLVFDKNDFALLSYGACVAEDESNFGTGYGFLITLIVTQILVLVLLGFLNQRVKRYPEEFQENKYIALLLAVLFQLYVLTIPVFITVVVNPIGRFLVISTFVFCTLFAILLFIFTPKMEQVHKNWMFRRWQAAQAKHYDGTSPDNNDNGFAAEVDFEEGIRNAYVREKFRKFAESNFVVESFYFYMDVEEFKEHPLTSMGRLDIQKARDIYGIYVREGSLLQINISGQAREQVSAAYHAFLAGKPSVSSSDDTSLAIDKTQALRTEFASIFNPAQVEIVDLLNTGAWRGFVEEGGMYRPPGFRLTQDSAPSPRAPLSKTGAENARTSPSQEVRPLLHPSAGAGPTTGEVVQNPALRNRGSEMGGSMQTGVGSGLSGTTVTTV